MFGVVLTVSVRSSSTKGSLIAAGCFLDIGCAFWLLFSSLIVPYDCVIVIMVAIDVFHHDCYPL